MSGELDEIIRRVKRIDGLVKRAAPACAEAFDAALRAELSAGQAPGGQAWEPTKQGKRPLQGAPDAVITKAVGTTIVSAIAPGKWFYKFHNAGTGRLPPRPVIPAKLWPGGAKAIRAALTSAFDREVRRGN